MAINYYHYLLIIIILAFRACDREITCSPMLMEYITNIVWGRFTPLPQYLAFSQWKPSTISINDCQVRQRSKRLVSTARSWFFRSGWQTDRQTDREAVSLYKQRAAISSINRPLWHTDRVKTRSPLMRFGRSRSLTLVDFRTNCSRDLRRLSRSQNYLTYPDRRMEGTLFKFRCHTCHD